MKKYDEALDGLRSEPRRWLVTGVAGFIGSHLLERLLSLGQTVVGLDNFATGSANNLADVFSRAGREALRRFRFLEGDVRDPRACRLAVRDADVVLHEAALASVPRSMNDPLSTHCSNVDGFVNVLLAANEVGARVVYASSSSVYGDDASPVKVEDRIGRPLSPYALSKLVNELCAETFRRTHGVESVGLRYFNVFGPRQDPEGPYAAVIPSWTERLLSSSQCVLFGDGEKSRDFCFIDNVVQANLLAACAPLSGATPRVFNVGCGARTTLLELFAAIRQRVATRLPEAASATLLREAPRPGDVPHSRASIDRARSWLGYEPAYDLARGLDEAVARSTRAARPRSTEAPIATDRASAA